MPVAILPPTMMPVMPVMPVMPIVVVPMVIMPMVMVVPMVVGMRLRKPRRHSDKGRQGRYHQSLPEHKVASLCVFEIGRVVAVHL